MASAVLPRLRVGWWAGAEPADPMAALTGSLLRGELISRCPGLRPVLVHGTPASWAEPGFSGEPAAVHSLQDWSGQSSPFDVLVASGTPEPGGAKLWHELAEAGALVVGVAPDEAWGWGPHESVGPPFAFPEPSVLAARHFPRPLLEARGAYLRVVEGLPRCYVLVEGTLFDCDEGPGAEDFELALGQLAKSASEGTPADVVRLSPGPLVAEDAEVEAVLRERRAEAEEGRHLAEDWPGYPDRARLPLRVTSPLDLAAAVAGAAAVVARSGPLMALAWALGTPHVAVAAEDSPADHFAAWTGDPSAVVGSPEALVAAMGNIFARRGKPPGLKRLEATVDQSLDEAASNLGKRTAVVAANGRAERAGASPAERLQELESVNEALRLRLAAERLRFAERAALLERAAGTTVESAIKAVHGQDVIVRRRLEQTEREMRRLQEETAVQQAELRAIYSTWAMRALTPARQWYGRLRRTSR